MFTEQSNLQLSIRDDQSEVYFDIANQLLDTYKNSVITKLPENTHFLINKNVDELIDLLLGCLNPGLHGTGFNWVSAIDNISNSLLTLQNKLSKIIHYAIYIDSKEMSELDLSEDCEACNILSMEFIKSLPDVLLSQCSDIKAAYEGDPSARSFEEIVLAYPGVLAITVYRLAHVLHQLNVPLLPRLMTEWSHSRTGIDIHPGAKIGNNFFIDHGTGVVIGETVVIGDNVKLYQGVTLGAISIPQNMEKSLKPDKVPQRHPTVQDNVTIYANATVLGGSTTIEKNCIVGGSAFIYESIPTGCMVKVDKFNHEIIVKDSA